MGRSSLTTRLMRPRVVAAGVLSAVLVVALAACAGSVAPVGAVDRVTAVSSPTPTERDGKTDDTNSKAFKAANRRQEVLMRFDAWVRAQPDVYGHGFIASVDDVKTTTVTLLWFGKDPWRNRLAAAGPGYGVTVRFQQRSQSLASFTAAQKRLSDAGARFKALGFALFTISGIEAKPEPLTMKGKFTTGADRAAVRALATRIARQPVLVRTGNDGF